MATTDKYYAHHEYGFESTNGKANKLTLKQIQKLANEYNYKYTACNCKTGKIEYIFSDYRQPGRD